MRRKKPVDVVRRGHAGDVPRTPDKSNVINGTRTTRWIVTTGSAILLAGACGVLAACGSSSSGATTSRGIGGGGGGSSAVNTPFQDSGTPVHGGILVFARNLSPATFTPWLPPEGNSELFAEKQIYDELVETSPDPAKLTPALADSWTVSPKRLVYTFHLRPKVKFSNGQPLQASDVKWSLDQERNPNVDPVRGGLLGPIIQSISIPDSSHVRITLKALTPAFLDYLTLGEILPASVVKRLGAKAFGKHPVGTGPFMVTSFTPGNPTIQLRRNPYYWRPGLPYLDGITYKYIPDDNARMLAVESGAADIGEAAPYSQLTRLQNFPGVKVFSQHAFSQDWILINTTKPPLNSVAVREALVYATPLNQISRAVFHGLAPAAATSSLPTKYWDQSIKPYPYDLAKARQLLAQAGHKTLNLKMELVGTDAPSKQEATIIQASWAQAGINLSLVEKDFNSVQADLTAESFQLVKFPTNAVTSDVPVDDEFDGLETAPPKAGNFPWTGWNNPQARQLVEQAAHSPDEATRQRDFSEYQRILYREQPIIGLVQLPNLYAVRTNVHGFVAVGTFWPILADTWLSR